MEAEAMRRGSPAGVPSPQLKMTKTRITTAKAEMGMMEEERQRSAIPLRPL
jgi:hypothetical protein